MMKVKIITVAVILGSVTITACSTPTAPDRAGTPGASFARIDRAFQIKKDCTRYTGHAGDTCTITESNLPAIEVGSTITYLSNAAGTALDTDVVLDVPGPGNNVAYGHCTLNLGTGVGACSLSGGTGKFIFFHASVAVSYEGGPIFAWTGTYSFSPRI